MPPSEALEMTDSYNQGNINAPAPNLTTNGEGAAMVEGNVVAQSAAADDTVILTTAVGQINVVGVVEVGADDGEPVALASASYPFNVLVTGAVVRGNFIEASGIAGIGIVGTAVGVFAIAIESNADVGVKLVRCRPIRSELF